MLKIIAFWIALALSSAIMAQPQNVCFKHITNNDNLSDNTVESIVQDSKGFMWFGTQNGLNKYDSYQMTVYKNIPNDTTSISNNHIKKLYVDRKNRLWILTFSGLNLYNEEFDIFRQYNIFKSSNNIRANHISSICEDYTNRLLVGTTLGLYIFDETTASLKLLDIQENGRKTNLNYSVTSMLEDKDHNLWIGTERNGVFVINQDNIIAHYTEEGVGNLCSNTIQAMAEDLNRNLWIGTDKGISLRNKDGLFTHLKSEKNNKNSLSSNVIKCIGTDHRGNVWVGTENGGLSIWYPQTKAFVRYENERENSFSLSQKTVFSFCVDMQGNVWLGTLKGGIELYTPNTARFGMYTERIGGKGLSYKDVKAFYENASGDIYIGTDGGGLNIWKRKTGYFSHYQHNPLNPNSIGSDAVLHIMSDSRGNIWIGTWGGGLNKFSPHTERFTRYTRSSSPNTISSDKVWVMYEDENKNFWVGTSYGGINLFNQEHETFSKLLIKQVKSLLDREISISSIIEDKYNNLWIGTNNDGVFCYDKKQDKFIQYFLNKNIPPEMTNILFIDSQQRLWAGERGLYYFDKANNSFHAVLEHGLNNEIIQSIEEDKHGNLWIGTNNGLIRYNPENNSFKRFITSDGLQGLVFGPKASLKTRKGEMLFGGSNGFNLFHPDSILSNQVAPEVYLTGLLLSNTLVKPALKESPLKKHITVADKIVLDYNQSVFSIEYVAINYISSEKNEYAYKLEGFDSDWNYVGNIRKCTYTNLNPGTYTFKVKACNNDGIWNEKYTSVDIIINPPFYMTWWFRSLIGIAIFAVLIFLYNYMRRRVLERKKEELHQTQLQFFTNISHELRTPLTLIQGSVDQLKNQEKENKYYKTIHRNTTRMISLVNELMNFRKVELGMLTLHIKETELNEMINLLSVNFDILSEQRGIKFLINQPQADKKIWIDQQVIEKILFNLLNNAFKYASQGGTVLLSASYTPFAADPQKELIYTLKNKYKNKNFLYLKVSDTGIGIASDKGKNLFQYFYRIAKNHIGSGIGLAFVKKLVSIHKGFIQVYSCEGVGSDFIVGIPYQKSDYNKDLFDDQKSMDLDTTLLEEQYIAEEQIFISDKEKTILLVEDDHELRAFIKECLQDYFSVNEAKNGLEAMDILSEQSIDLIISDVMMPEMDGIELCKRVKETSSLSHIPFLMLTAKNTLESKLEGIEHGADYYLTKPFSVRLLQLTIKNIFEQHKKLKLLYLKDYQSEIQETIHTSKNKEFIDRLLHIIDDMLDEPELNFDYISRNMGMSKTKIYNTLKDITGQNITGFIRTLRLKKAIYIMTHEDVTINEVVARVGFISASYFASIFKKEFGKSPSLYLKDLKNNNT